MTAKDLIGRDETVLIERVMTKETVTVKLHMSIQADVAERTCEEYNSWIE